MAAAQDSGFINKASASSFELPKATWSVADLELSKQHEPISEVELKKLARRAMLDMDQLDDNTRQQLRQDLGNMMHMIQQVQSFHQRQQHQSGDDDDFLNDSDIYDKPRGVTVATLRDDSAQENYDDQKVSKTVWNSFLLPNTTKVGAHNYFSIETKRDRDKKAS